MSADQVPPHARELYILTGYRRPLGPGDSLAVSAFSGLLAWHNQTTNVWSHFLGMGWALARLGATLDANGLPPIARISIAAFHSSSACVLGLSTTAHLLAPVVKPSASGHLWQLDRSAIILSVGGSFAPGLSWGFRCYPVVRAVYTSVVLAGLVLGAHCTLVAASAAQEAARATADRRRIIVLTGTGAFGLVPLGHWVCVAAHADVALLLPGVLTMFACYALGVFFFVTHLPERLAPGRFDSGFSSHPLWHVCILAGMWSWDATLRQMIYREWTCEGESS